MVYIMNKKHFNDEEMQKLNERNGYIFPFSLNSLLNTMTVEEEGITSRAIRQYVQTRKVTEINPKSFPYVALNQFIEFYDKEALKYLNKCKTNQKTAIAREEAKKHPKYG